MLPAYCLINSSYEVMTMGKLRKFVIRVGGEVVAVVLTPTADSTLTSLKTMLKSIYKGKVTIKEIPYKA